MKSVTGVFSSQVPPPEKPEAKGLYNEEMVDRVIANGPEIIVYFLIEGIGSYRYSTQRGVMKGHIPDSCYKEMEGPIAQQFKLLQALPRFGVVTPLDANGQATPEYWKWYRWWDAWNKGMSDEQFQEMDTVLGENMTPEQIAKWRPPGSWES